MLPRRYSNLMLACIEESRMSLRTLNLVSKVVPCYEGPAIAMHTSGDCQLHTRGARNR